MESIEIKISLDPVNDGIQTDICKIDNLTDPMAIVIGTNGDYRVISGCELEKILKEMGDDCVSVSTGEFITYLNGNKTVCVDTEDYLIGSVVMTYWSRPKGLTPMNKTIIEQAIATFRRNLVELCINDKSISAFVL